MDYNKSIEMIKNEIRTKEYKKAEEMLLSLIKEAKVKNVEDENNIYHSFNNYVEQLLFWNIYKPQKKNRFPDINYSQVYYYLGYINIETENNEKALEYLKEGLKWNPVDMQLMFEIATVHRLEGNIEKFKAQIEKAYHYIYNSSYMAKYYRELGWYYSEKRIFDIANALYTHSISYEKNDLAINELMYIAKQENRELRLSTSQEISEMLAEYNIPSGFSKSMAQVIFNEYEYLIKNVPNAPTLRFLSRTLYEITLDKQFMIYTTLKDEELGVSIKVPENWRYLEKSAYEEYNITPNTRFFLLTPNNREVSITCEGKCTEEQLQDIYLLSIDKMKKQGIEVIKEYYIRGEKNIKQVFVDVKKNSKVLRSFQNYLVANDYLFNISWPVANNIEIDNLYNSVNNSLAMDVVWSLSKLNVQIENKNIELNKIIEEYRKNGISPTLFKLLSNLSKDIIKGDKQDPFWIEMAKNVFETLILLNIPEENQLGIKTLLEQSKDINKARQICKKNVNKLDIAELQKEKDYINAIKTLNSENNDKTLSSILAIIYDSLLSYEKEIISKETQDNNKKNNVETENNLKAYLQEMEEYPTFKFYFPENLGEQSKVQNNIFELRKNNKQIVRVMVSKCSSEEKLEQLASNWIEKTRTTNKQEIKSFVKEKIGNQAVLSYILGGEKQLDKIYKMVYKNNCWITISGTLNEEKVNIINTAIEKLELVENKNDKEKTAKSIVIDCPFCNNSFELKWNVPTNEKTFYCKCPNCDMELKRENPNYKG